MNIISVRDLRGRVRPYLVRKEYESRPCPVCNTRVLVLRDLTGAPVFLDEPDGRDGYVLHENSCLSRKQKANSLELEAACRDLLEIYAQYREYCIRQVPMRPSEAEKQASYSMVALLTKQLARAIDSILKQDGATTPHGFVSRKIAPVLDVILPPPQMCRGRGQWFS